MTDTYSTTPTPLVNVRGVGGGGAKRDRETDKYVISDVIFSAVFVDLMHLYQLSTSFSLCANHLCIYIYGPCGDRYIYMPNLKFVV